MARVSAVEAGRKGGQARSIRKTLACRANGFQSCKTSETERRNVTPAPRLILPQQKASQ